MPAKLTVTDDAGHSVTVTGEIPQTAQHRPTDLPVLQKQFDKLGDTVYTAGTVTADIAGMLMLPASALNAMRREAAERMDAACIRSSTPVHTLQAVPPFPNQRKIYENTPFRVQIRRKEQLAGLAQYAAEIDALLLPLHLAEDYLAGAQPVPLSRCMLVPPRFSCDEAAVLQMLKNSQAGGFSQMLCQHAADVQLGKECGMTLHGGLGLHITNSHAAEFYAQAGLADALCSPEAPEMPAQCLPLGRMAYGRLPLMLTRNCPVQAQIGCGKCQHRLTDRRGAAVYTDCTRITEKPDYAELFNAVPLWLADQPQKLADAAFGLLLMTDESAEQVQQVLGAYLHGDLSAPPQKYTRGLRIQQESAVR